MTQELYRKEALENRNRSLFGEIRLRADPAMWWVTLLLLALTALVFGGLFLGKISTGDETITLFEWLLRSLSIG